MAFDPIFEPLTFRNLTIKNRIIRANMSGRIDQYDGSGTQARINFETKFARGGVGAIVSSFANVQLRGRIMPNYAMIDHDRHIPFWRAVGKAVHAFDCKYILQLSHGGRQRDIPGFEFATGLSSTDKDDPRHGFRCERMTVAQIKETVRAFADGARRAREAGLDGVELHGVERLPDLPVPQFCHQRPQGRIRRLAREPRPVRARDRRARSGPRRRRRLSPPDEDRRPRRRRCRRILREGSRRATRSRNRRRSAVGWSMPASTPFTSRSAASFRIRATRPAPTCRSMTWCRPTTRCSLAASAAFRTYLLFKNFPELARRQWNEAAPKPDEIEGQNLADARRLKSAVYVPVICTGGFQTASVIAAALERHDCDAVSIARPLIANNDLVEIFRRGQDRADRPCTYCNRCLAHVVKNPLGCYDESRYPSREAMIADIMSVFDPPDFT